MTKADFDFDEFEGQFWFFQLLVWVDFLAGDMPKTVLETGTHHGAGAFRWSKVSETVHTTELSESLFLAAQERYKNEESIHFHNLASPAFLREVLPHITERCLIFLDAHGSGGDTTFDDSVGRYGSPILDELLAIKESSTRNDHVIVIDDCDDIGTMDYPTKQEVCKALWAINEEYEIDLDTPRHLLLSRGTGIAYTEGEQP